ncbi:MAG: hypothetical protein QOH34_1148, partial [Mycobacterium sp.]|nr:hypothetical protein [Mycobacterium sp.]
AVREGPLALDDVDSTTGGTSR